MDGHDHNLVVLAVKGDFIGGGLHVEYIGEDLEVGMVRVVVVDVGVQCGIIYIHNSTEHWCLSVTDVGVYNTYWRNRLLDALACRVDRCAPVIIKAAVLAKATCDAVLGVAVASINRCTCFQGRQVCPSHYQSGCAC